MAKKQRAGVGSDEVLDALYAAPPRAFVAERKRAAAALTAQGRTEEARAVARLKRPSASVWAVNQLARRAPDELAELMTLGATLRSEERKVMRGGAADQLMTDARTARQKVATLARRAESFVAESGQKVTSTLGRKISQTLHAASIADDETRARLEAGRMLEDLVPPSTFGGGGDLATTLAASLGASPKKLTRAEPKPARAARPRAAHERKHGAHERKQDAAHERKQDAAVERKRAAAERKRAAAEVRKQRRAQAAARKHAATLERAAAGAARIVAERTRAVDKARAAVDRAESDLRAAKDALVDAETAAAAARRAADEAAAAAR